MKYIVSGTLILFLITSYLFLTDAPPEALLREKPVVIGLGSPSTESNEIPSDQPEQATLTEAQDTTISSSFELAKDRTLFHSLISQGVPAQTVVNLVNSLKEKLNLRQLQTGTLITITQERANNQYSQFVIQTSKLTSYIADAVENKFEVKKVQKPITTKVQFYSGTVISSLWESAAAEAMSGQVIQQLSDIFAWQIDFEREVRKHDKWRLTIEKKYVDGTFYGFGNILAAEYLKRGESHIGIRYPVDTNEYYDPSGMNLRGIFLKSPLRYSRISSRFHLKRFHPILKIRRPHYGVDYAAATGTPVRSVGDGVVTRVGYSKAAGNMIKIRHNSNYSTAYKHLSRFAKIKKNQRVMQGQLIGYVGSTGLASGPHLHFEFYENGRYVDPLGRKFPREKAIPKADLKAFKTYAATMEASLPAWQNRS